MRDVLYPQNTQASHINPNIIQQFLPDPNMPIQKCPNTSYMYNTDMSKPVPQAREQEYPKQQRSFMINSTIGTNTNQQSSTTTNGNGKQNSSAVSEAPQWVAHMQQNFDIRLQQIENQLVRQNTNWQNINMTLQNQNDKMAHLENKMSEIDIVKENVTKCESSLNVMGSDISQTNKKIVSYNESIKKYSDMCDGIISDQNYTDSAINSLFKRVEHLEKEQDLLKTNTTQSASAITDLQCKSMRDNLIFTGIEEPELYEGDYENTEKVLCEFLENEMNIDKTIPFHRVHRIGNFESDYDSPRPIVAKFERFKDREKVRLAATRTLKDKPYGVREQFPKVVEDRRKMLYPEMKKARSDKHNKVRLVRDRLFINNVEFVTDSHSSSLHQNRGQSQDFKQYNKQPDRRHEYERSQGSQRSQSTYSDVVRSTDRNRDSGYGKSRVLYAHTTGQSKRSNQQQSSNVKSLNFEIPTSNRFSSFSNEENNSGDKPPTESKKHKASSPLDMDKHLKKHRENRVSDQEGTDSDTS